MMHYFKLVRPKLFEMGQLIELNHYLRDSKAYSKYSQAKPDSLLCRLNSVYEMMFLLHLPHLEQPLPCNAGSDGTI